MMQSATSMSAACSKKEIQISKGARENGPSCVRSRSKRGKALPERKLTGGCANSNTTHKRHMRVRLRERMLDSYARAVSSRSACEYCERSAVWNGFSLDAKRLAQHGCLSIGGLAQRPPVVFSNLARRAAVHVRDTLFRNSMNGGMCALKHVKGHVFQGTGPVKEGMGPRIYYTQAGSVVRSHPWCVSRML